jgi:hypothetical protein
MAKGIKTGGRQQGTPNRLTKEIRSVLKDFVHREIEMLPDYMETLENEARIQLLIKIIPFVLPRIKEVSHRDDEPFEFDGW